MVIVAVKKTAPRVLKFLQLGGEYQSFCWPKVITISLCERKVKIFRCLNN